MIKEKAAFEFWLKGDPLNMYADLISSS